MTTENSLTIGSRNSRLAMWQAQYICDKLAEKGVFASIQTISTFGDRDTDTPLPKFGEKGIFTAELDAALIDGRIDLAVHSLKDLPTILPAELNLAAIPERASARDVLVALDPAILIPEDLPFGAQIATSSRRRTAQLLAWRSDLKMVDVRGNVETRLRKLEEFGWDGIVLAEAGLERLGLRHRVSFCFPYEIMLPAAGQGALGVVTASGSAVSKLISEQLDDSTCRVMVEAERSFLQRLDGGCQAPIGANASLDSDGMHKLVTVVLSVDGTEVIRGSAPFDTGSAIAVGKNLAEDLIGQGANRLLREARDGGSQQA